MSSLRDALEKAGLKGSKEEVKKPEKKSVKKPFTPKKKHDHHYQTNNFCSNCRKNAPDVELYGAPRAKGRERWLCVACADEQMILDDNRLTVQSDFSKRGMFRRQYGRTLPPRIIEKKQAERKEQEKPKEKTGSKRFNERKYKGSSNGGNKS